MRRSLALVLILALAILPACKPSGNEAYAEALILLGEAERGACNMGFDKATGQQIINVGRINDCLTKTQAALDKLVEAKQLGVDHREANELITKTEEEVRRLESMKRTVLRMENKLDFEDAKE
jgi:hypothetical protein